MVCTNPLTMYPTDELTDNGKRKYTFNCFQGFVDLAIKVPCGRCLGCQMDKARANGFRILDESRMFSHNCFITLTVGDKYLDEIFPNNNLSRKPFQDFAKRLRKEFAGFDRIKCPKWFNTQSRGSWNEFPIRIVYCGEYGSQNLRPHFHAILMNFDFEDKQFYKRSDNGSDLFLSESLMKLWPYGMADIGEVNYQSAFYLSRYVIKKQEDAKNSLLKDKTPAFVQYPSRFGVGRLFYDKYKMDMYGPDAKVMNGYNYKVPRFYDKKYAIDNPEDMSYLKDERLWKAKQNPIPVNLLRNKEELLKLAVKRKTRK